MELIPKPETNTKIRCRPRQKLVIVECFDEDEIKILVTTPVKKVQTEDLGKIFEMGVCLLYNTPYDGTYKYSMEEAQQVKERIAKLLEMYPYPLIHTAKSGARYDFTGLEDQDIKLSAKTTKKDGKIAPQVIGQPSKKKFCQHFGVPETTTLDEIKEHIMQNVTNMLSTYEECTFDCPTIYYNKKSNKLIFVKKVAPIQWHNFEIEFSHIKKNKVWGESSCISVGGITIGEFQIHNHRDCIKFRWAFEKLLDKFPECFEITNL
jgi:hypothetical protein